MTPLMVYRFLFISSSVFAFTNLNCLKKNVGCSLTRMAIKGDIPGEVTIFTDRIAQYKLNALESSTKVSKSSVTEEIRLMQNADVSSAENFFTRTLPNLKKNRAQAKAASDYGSLLAIDKSNYELSNAGFQRILYSEKVLGREDDFLFQSAEVVRRYCDIGKSKEEQLKDLEEEELEQRPGFIQFVPKALVKYVDYYKSLIKPPKEGDFFRTMFVSAFLSFIVWANTSARSAFMYFIIAKLLITSLTLSRGMPFKKPDPMMGGAKKQAGTWSSNAFYTAISLTLLLSSSSFLVSSIITNFLPFRLDAATRIKSAMIASIMASGYFSTYFEAYEEKSKNGWRWKKAMDEVLPADVKAKLRSKVYGKQQLTALYDFEYDPDVDDNPPLAKYFNEDKPVDESHYSEDDSAKYYEDWREERKESRRPPIKSIAPETPWIGGKKGLYPVQVPDYLVTAYKKSLLKMKTWTKVPAKEVQATIEFSPVEGPLAFRDKRPEWLELFGTGIWLESNAASAEAARAFGTYRKTMFKRDPKVIRQKYDS